MVVEVARFIFGKASRPLLAHCPDDTFGAAGEVVEELVDDAGPRTVSWPVGDRVGGFFRARNICVTAGADGRR